MIEKKGWAEWQGGLKDGMGSVSLESGVLQNANYGFNKRFGGEPGSNPEELLAAAHAACFSMALSNILGEAGFTPDRIRTSATITLDPESLSITGSHLEVEASVPGASAEEFGDCAEKAKANCPVSKLFNAEITMEATLA